MKKLAVLMLFAVLGVASCGPAKTTNNSTNIQVNSVATLPISGNSNQILQNTNAVTQSNSELTPEMMKQIEAQQRETSDPQKTTNSNIKQPPPNRTGNSQRQIW